MRRVRPKCLRQGHVYRRVPSITDPFLPLEVCRRWLCEAHRFRPTFE